MLTRLRIRNFKKFDEVEVDLASPVLFIGPNNSGKTSAMQALALWSVGLQRWNEKRLGAATPARRPGVAVNRRDLLAVPIPAANLLWRDLRVRDVRKVDGRQQTSNIRIDVVVDGVAPDGAWTCGLEFDYANEESLYCRPLRTSAGKEPDRMEVPAAAADVNVAFLPPMSGLAGTETRLDSGAIDVRIGEGRTAEVLRNLCYRIYQEDSDSWGQLVEQILRLFGADLDPPKYVPGRGEITMSYREGGVALDLSSAGRGLQQTLLILAYMYSNPGSVLLLDEPDAHLEILRQRQIYAQISDSARGSGSQVIAASHSEILLNEAAGKDNVVAFVGRPHQIDQSRQDEVLKSLSEIGWEHYYQAVQKGWVLYLEGSTDLAILKSFARRLGHAEAAHALERPFVHYVGNDLRAVRRHFHGLKEAVADLKGVALFDRLGSAPDLDIVQALMWTRREVENYFCSRNTLEGFAAATGVTSDPDTLFHSPERHRHVDAMRAAIEEVTTALRMLGKGSPWSPDLKASDEVLPAVFDRYYTKLRQPNVMDKKHFHRLAEYVLLDEIDDEVRDKLDAIAAVALQAEESLGNG